MHPVAYTVTATFSRPQVISSYVSWLAQGHAQQVCAGGALSAQVVVQDVAPGEPPSVQVRYLFPDRETLERYFTDHAPRLRAEGLALFGPGSGVSFHRSTGVVAHVESKQ